LKHHPVKLGGKTSPDAVDQWLKDMLTGEAKHWWTSTKSSMEERGELVTWEAFRGKFLSE